MMNGKRGRGWAERSLQEAPDADAVELLANLRDLFSEYPVLLCVGPEKVARELHILRGIRADVCAVEAVLEVLRVEGEVLA
jgi:hypothetical protein